MKELGLCFGASDGLSPTCDRELVFISALAADGKINAAVREEGTLMAWQKLFQQPLGPSLMLTNLEAAICDKWCMAAAETGGPCSHESNTQASQSTLPK